METFRSKDAEKEGVIGKYSSVIFKMEAEISKLTTENQSLAKEAGEARAEAERTAATNAQLQKMLSTEKSLNNNQTHRESDLKLELGRLETEKNEFYAQIKRLEGSLEAQLQREAEFKKKTRERELKAEEERTAFALQVQSRNKMVEEILHLQAQQQSEIAGLQMRMEEARLRADASDKNWSAAVMKEQVERAELQKKLHMAEELLESEKQGRVRDTEDLMAQLENERDRNTRDGREGKMLQMEHKKLKKELAEAVRRVDELTNELEVRTLQVRSQTDKYVEGEERQKQKEKLWQQEIDFLKSQVSKAVADGEGVYAQTKRRLEEELEERTLQLQSVQAKLKAETLEHEMRVRVLEAERTELKVKAAAAEAGKTRCTRCEEHTGRKNSLAPDRRASGDATKPSLDRIASENEQLGETIKKYKTKLKALMTKNDELKNENQFFESKIEKLERRMMDLIYGDTVEQRAAEESEKLRLEVERDVIRPQKQKPEADAVDKRGV